MGFINFIKDFLIYIKDMISIFALLMFAAGYYVVFCAAVLAAVYALCTGEFVQLLLVGFLIALLMW